MIRIDQVKKDYGSFLLDLKDVSFPKGQITGLVGVNGSGKTTTFKLICGLVPPSEGEIFLEGQKTWPLPVALKQEIGVVFADSGFLSMMSAKDIAFVLKGFFKNFDQSYFDQLLQKLNLPSNKPLSQFSTGMQVRMKLVAALCHHPKLLILDEPTAGMDVIARHQVHELLQEYMEEGDHTILISSHIASDLEAICDDFWMIHEGKMRLHESIDALQSDYGILSISPQQFKTLDRSGMVAYRPYPGGYQVLVKDRHFYQENNLDLTLSKGNLDDLILILERGEIL